MFEASDVLSNLSFFLVFVEGLLSFFSPCVLPLLPVYMGYLAGKGEEEYSRKKVFIFTLSFILGIFVAIFLMNISIHVISTFLQSHMTLFVKIGGALIILLGLHQLGFIKFNRLEKTYQMKFKQKKSMNIVMAFVMGFTFSFAWTPCIGPALSSILLLASSSGSLAVSNFLILLYALGFTIPFLILGLFTNQVLHWLSAKKVIMKYTVKIGAVILILMGLMMFTGKLNTISSYMSKTPDISDSSNKKTKEEEQKENKEKQEEQKNAENGSVLGFTLKDQNGNIVSLEDYKGKVIFLNFWATWCPPCQRELPHIQDLYEKYKDSKEVAVLTVTYPYGQDKNEEVILDFVKSNNYTMPVLLDNGQMFTTFQITSMPTTYMIDKEGKPYGYIRGQLTKEMMQKMIDDTLKNSK